jgi:hypothetical protein
MSWSWGKGTSAICWRITPPNTMGCAFEDVPSATCWDREFADSPLEEDGFELQVPFFEKLCRVLSKGNAER